MSGLWHGASWNYVIWGAVHGIYQVAGGITKNFRRLVCTLFNIDRQTTQYKLFQRILTFAMVCFGWIFFRSTSLTEALLIIKKIITDFEPWSIYGGGIATMGLDNANLLVLVLSLVLLYCVSKYEYNGKSAMLRIEKMNIFARWPVYFGLLFAVLILGIYGPGFAASQFIYFQF